MSLIEILSAFLVSPCMQHVLPVSVMCKAFPQELKFFLGTILTYCASCLSVCPIHVCVSLQK